MRTTRAIIALTILAVELLAAPSARSQSRATFIPALSIGAVHDDNLFSETTGDDDLMTQLRPSFEGYYQSPTVNLESLFSFDMQRSLNHESLNTVDARRLGMFDGQLRATPSILLGVAARYDRINSPTDLNLLSASLLDRQRATRWQLTPSIAFRLTPRTTLTTRYDWTTESLSHEMGNELRVARIGVSRQWSPRTTWSMGYLGRLFDDSLNQQHSQAVMFGWSREMAPGTNLSLQAGPRATSYRGVTSEILATWLRRTPRNRLLLDYWHGETIILGIPGPVQIQSGTTRMTWYLTRMVEVGAGVGAFNSKTLENTEAIVYQASVVGAWSFHDLYTLSMSYGAEFQRGDIRSPLLADERVRRGVFLVRLTVAPRISRAFKPKPREESDQPTPPLKGVLQ